MATAWSDDVAPSRHVGYCHFSRSSQTPLPTQIACITTASLRAEALGFLQADPPLYGHGPVLETLAKSGLYKAQGRRLLRAQSAAASILAWKCARRNQRCPFDSVATSDPQGVHQAGLRERSSASIVMHRSSFYKDVNLQIRLDEARPKVTCNAQSDRQAYAAMPCAKLIPSRD